MGPRLFQHLDDHYNPLVTSLSSAWSPAHEAIGTTTLQSSISRMLHRDISSVLASHSNTIQKQIMRRITNFISQAAVWRLWNPI